MEKCVRDDATVTQRVRYPLRWKQMETEDAECKNTKKEAETNIATATRRSKLFYDLNAERITFIRWCDQWSIGYRKWNESHRIILSAWKNTEFIR